MYKTIKAISFDVGGVIVNNGFNKLYYLIKKNIPLDYDTFNNIFITCYQAVKLRLNLITLYEYWQYIRHAILAIYNIDIFKHYTIKELEYVLFNGFENRTFVQEIMQYLKNNGYFIMIMSNECEEKAKYLQNKFTYNNIVDKSILSCNIGSAKPDLNFFIKSLNLVDFNSNEILFIDDRIDNILMAQFLGFNVLHYHNKFTKETFERSIWSLL